jgi:hypothetical protein
MSDDDVDVITLTPEEIRKAARENRLSTAQLARAVRYERLTGDDLTEDQRKATAAELRRQAQGHFEHAEELRHYEPGDERRTDNA